MNRSIAFVLNRGAVRTGLPAGTVTLDYLRRERRLTGTREGCREGDCGACAVLLGELMPKAGVVDAGAATGRAGSGQVLYRTVNSCLLPLGELQGRHLVTVEGLNPLEVNQRPESTLPALSPIQECFLEEGASQCGFCTPGFVVALSGYLLRCPRPVLDEALEAVAGNICRCTGYASIRRAIARLLERCRPGEAGQTGTGVESRGDVVAAAGSRAAAGTSGASGGGPANLRRLVELGIVPRYFLDIPARLESLAASERKSVRREDRSGGAGRGAEVLVAGGTDLFVQRPEELEDGPLRFLGREEGLSGLRRDNGRIMIGAGATMEQLRDLPELAATTGPIAEALQWIASSPIRQRATVGGNLVNASPIGDLTVLFLALGARLGLKSADGMREVALEDFYRGYKQLDLASGEVLAWVAFVPPVEGAFVGFEKVARRKHLDIASVNSAALLKVEAVPDGQAEPGAPGGGGRILEARLSAGGVAPVPLLLPRSAQHLVGKAVSPQVFREALDIAQEEIAPISDVRGSAGYKRLALRQLLIAHFLGAFAQELAGEDWR